MEIDRNQPRVNFTIFAATNDCRLSLQHCAQVPELIELHWAENRLSDFNLWDAGVGASARALNSLDVRLRNDVVAKKVVISSLSTLRTWAIVCRDVAIMSRTTQDKPPNAKIALSHEGDTSEDSNDITLEEAKHSVEQLLKVLVNLGVAIRQAGAASRLSNADRTFEKYKHRYSPLIEHLTFLLRVSGIPRSGVQDGNGDTEGRIQTCVVLEEVVKQQQALRYEQKVLIEANAKRLHRFHFSKERSKALEVASELQNSAQAPIPQEKPIHLSPGPRPISALQHHKTTPSTSSNDDVKNYEPSHSQQSITSANQLSDHRAGALLGDAVDGLYVGAPPTAIALNADYPPPPKVSQSATGIVCPYCNLTMPSAIAQPSQWKKHVSEDLQPYTCYLPSCPQENPLFDTFHAWKTHLSSNHHMLRGWTCVFCEEPRNFTQERFFNDHVKITHVDEVAEELLVDLSTACQMFNEPNIDRCPVCSTYEVTWKQRKAANHSFETRSPSFLEHIGKCMHEFALRALPTIALDESAEEGTGAPTGISNLDSRSSLSSVIFSDRGEDRRGLKKADLLHTTHLSGRDKVDDWLTVTSWEPSDDLASMQEISLLEPQAPDSYIAIDKVEVTKSRKLLPMRQSLVGHGSQPSDCVPTASSDEKNGLDMDNDLSAEIKKRLVQSVFGQTPCTFMPRGSLDSIVTTNAVYASMGISLPNEDDKTLLDFILNRGKRIFAVTMFAGRQPLDLYNAMVLFYNNDFDDGRLPVEPWSHEYPDNPQRDLHPFQGMNVSSQPNRSIWSTFHITRFIATQRIFLAPVFTTDDLNHDLGERILPFIWKQPKMMDDFFITVSHYEIHKDHIAGLATSHGRTSRIFTVKQTKHIDMHDRRVKASQWDSEVTTLAQIRALDQDHIVRFITAFRWGKLDVGLYSVFEWAEGGNLLEIWEAMPQPPLMTPFLYWVVRQLYGLAQALRAVHDMTDDYESSHTTYSHPNLTPASIYWFGIPRELGTLKIGDWGRLSKAPIMYDTRACYAPPEVDARRAVTHSTRPHNMWAMGCIILEFLVWALYGLDDLDSLIKSEEGKFGVGPLFYESNYVDQRETAQVHSTVRSIMERMAHEPCCRVGTTALGDVLEIVQNGLLVVDRPNRVTAQELCDRLERINMTTEVSYWTVQRSRPPPATGAWTCWDCGSANSDLTPDFCGACGASR
ncbi:Nn.00g024040.m01.CDS01 [Neocucurbitaria sp. VM-36]